MRRIPIVVELRALRAVYPTASKRLESIPLPRDFNNEEVLFLAQKITERLEHYPWLRDVRNNTKPDRPIVTITASIASEVPTLHIPDVLSLWEIKTIASMSVAAVCSVPVATNS